MIEIFGLRFEKRERSSSLWQGMMTLLAIVASLLITSALIASAGANVGSAFLGLYEGAFGSYKAIIETLVKATPLILTGLAVTVAFRGKIWNIGAEGQLWAGAMAGYWASANLTALPSWLHLIVIMAFAFIGGVICGLVPGFLRAYLNVNETIVTVMMNYVVHFLLSYLLSGPWQDPGEYYYISSPVPESAYYPQVIPGTRLHLGFIVAIVATLLVYWMLQKTRLGYEIRGMGINPIATKFKGVNIARVILITMLISGGIAGLAGVGEVVGLHHRLRADISKGLGFTGIIVAMLGNLDPLAVVVAAIFFGALINGSNTMQIYTGVPVALVSAMQAIVLLCLLSFQVLANYRIVRVKDVE